MTAGPTCSTMPAASQPRISGKPDGNAPGQLALADLRVDRVDPGRAVADEHEVRADGRRLDLRLVQRLGPAPLVDDHRVHQPLSRTRALATEHIGGERVDAVEEQQPVEMVDLVLQAARLEALGAERRRRPMLDLDRGGAAHVGGQLGDAQAALAADLGALRADDPRVDEHEPAVRASSPSGGRSRRRRRSAPSRRAASRRARRSARTRPSCRRGPRVTRAISPASRASRATCLSAGCG